MEPFKLVRLLIVLAFVALMALLPGWTLVSAEVPSAREAPSQEAGEDLVVFLVRHAEKVDDGRDPELSAEGQQRAGTLVTTLRDAGIEHLHSSDYLRTRDTAAPIAAKLDLDIEIYDARELPKLVEMLRAAGGRHLVVGHSNTTPEVVALLGGEPGTAIDEPSEYDRLYIVTVADGRVSTVLLRYGS